MTASAERIIHQIKKYMKKVNGIIIGCLLITAANSQTAKTLFIDVHELDPGKVRYEDVLAAHQKDLAAEGKYGVDFIKFWVDEKMGKVYCLSSATDSAAIAQTHAEAHGLMPSRVYAMTQGASSTEIDGQKFFLDIHDVPPGKVTPEDVAGAHAKDLAAEGKYGVNFIDYWLDSKSGKIMCLSQAPNAEAVLKTHKEAHGLMPVSIEEVKEGH